MIMCYGHFMFLMQQLRMLVESLLVLSLQRGLLCFLTIQNFIYTEFTVYGSKFVAKTE